MEMKLLFDLILFMGNTKYTYFYKIKIIIHFILNLRQPNKKKKYELFGSIYKLILQDIVLKIIFENKDIYCFHELFSI